MSAREETPPPGRNPVKLDHIFESALYVNDLVEAEKFYTALLGIPPYATADGRHVFYKLRHGMLLLFDPRTTADPASELPPHGATGPGHMAFRVALEELPAWRNHLAELGIAIEKEWTWPNGAPSVYFRDPAGNVLELTVGALWGFD